VDRGGRVLGSCIVISEAQASLLSKERIADLVREGLGMLGR